MGSDRNKNSSSGSTTWAYRKVRVKRGAAGTDAAARRASSWSGLRRADRRDGTSIRITYRGGSESWWLVEARGKKVPVPGWLAVEDLMVQILQER